MNPSETHFWEAPEEMRGDRKLRGKRKTRTNTDFMSVSMRVSLSPPAAEDEISA
jgi:hypothetical protein